MPIKKYMRKASVSEVSFFSEPQTDGINQLDQVDRPPSSFHVRRWDIFALVYSILVHIIDVGFDINLAYHYFKKGSYTYFIWTTSFMLIPAIIITVISWRMYIIDNQLNVYKPASQITLQRRFLCILVLFLQLAPVLRYCDSLNYALQSRRAEKQKDKKKQVYYYRRMLNEDSDVALLRVFECYLESAPQLVLQFAILLLEYSQGSTFHILQQCGSIASSFGAMAWCMASYNRSIRFDQDDKNNLSWCATFVHFLWHLNVAISRILSISIVASLFPSWTCLAIAIHWIGISFWLGFVTKTNFCGESRKFEIFFYAMCGLVYIFNFFSLAEGSTKKYYCTYYPIFFFENVAAVIVWVFLSGVPTTTWYYYPLIVVPLVSFLLGMLFLIVYYHCLHPNVLSPKKNGQVFDVDSAGQEMKLIPPKLKNGNNLVAATHTETPPENDIHS